MSSRPPYDQGHYRVIVVYCMVSPCEQSSMSVLSHMIYPSDPLSDCPSFKTPVLKSPSSKTTLTKEDSLVIVPVVDTEASLQVDVKPNEASAQR